MKSTLTLLVAIPAAFVIAAPIFCENNPLTAEQTAALAKRISENTPEHLHFDKGTKFSWVLLVPGESNPAAVNDAVARLFEKSYTVYRSENEIPASFIHRDGQGKPVGYMHGFRFSFHVQLLADGVVNVKYHDWEGNQAASWHHEKYQWSGSDWITTEKDRLLVS